MTKILTELVDKKMDLSFRPYDDISYHAKEEKKNGVRCVSVIPNGYVKTIYVDRWYEGIARALHADDELPISSFLSETVTYMSNGEPRELSVISIAGDKYQSMCVSLNGVPHIYATACIITGKDFTDLTMEECYSLVTSARAKWYGELCGISVDIHDDMNLMPRLVWDEE